MADPLRVPSRGDADVRLVSIGLDYRHGPDFTIDRPRGSGDWLFVHFTTPICVLGGDGVKQVVGGPSCMVYAPGQPQWYRGTGQGFANNWLHASGGGVDALVQDCAIPTGTVLKPVAMDGVAAGIAAIKREDDRRRVHWQLMVAMGIGSFIVALARELDRPGQDDADPLTRERRERFRDLRTLVHDRLEQRWTVTAMAARLGLGPSRFAALYTTMFGVSPIEDLIRARLARACWLLTNSTLRIAAVAAESGFENSYYFSRIFHRRLGCAPRDYYGIQVPNPGTG